MVIQMRKGHGPRACPADGQPQGVAPTDTIDESDVGAQFIAPAFRPDQGVMNHAPTNGTTAHPM